MKKRKPHDRALRKITTTGGYSYYVTIPKLELESLGWREGEEVSVRRRGRALVIEKK